MRSLYCLLFAAALMSVSAFAQEPAAAPAAKPAAAAAPAPAPKAEAPKPITQIEKDGFHRAYAEYLELQNGYATKLLSLKTQIEDLEKTSNTEVAAKAQAIQQLFGELSKRCTAPKVFDRLSADCQDAPKK